MERLEKLVGDGAYLGKFAQQAYKQGWIFERASRPESAKGLYLLPNAGWSNAATGYVRSIGYQLEQFLPQISQRL